jgi:hypothetical protein
MSNTHVPAAIISQIEETAIWQHEHATHPVAIVPYQDLHIFLINSNAISTSRTDIILRAAHALLLPPSSVWSHLKGCFTTRLRNISQQ